MSVVLGDPQSLSLAEQVAQMLVVRASGHLFDHQIKYPSWEPQADILQGWLQDLGIGGVILLGGSAAELALRCQQLQDWAQRPLFLAADIEEGVGQRFTGATWFPPPMALAAIATQDLAAAQAYARQMGAITAQEALTVGLNWVLAPVVDVNNNPQNPVINVRAFGDDPATVAALATAYIQGAQAHPVLTTAKHFPGHGDTAIDSHLDLPTIPHTLDRLQSLEYPPFEAAIAAGVDGVMSAHLLIPAIDPLYPATLSDRILTGELRKKLNFNGLIVTDALVMGAIANRYGANEAAVLAVEAGADILMMPADPPGAIEAICKAVETGRIPAERITTAVERIWQAKTKLTQLSVEDEAQQKHGWEVQPPAPICLDQLAQPAALATATNILEAASQVYGQITEVVPGARTVILVDDLLDCAELHRKAAAIALPQKLGYHVQIIDSHTPETRFPETVTEPQPTLLQVFVRGNPFRGSCDRSERVQAWFDHLIQTQQLQALVIYGSPYLFEHYRTIQPEGVPIAFSYGQMPSAQHLMLEKIFSPLIH